MKGTPLDYGILVAYFAFILGFGTFFARYSKSTRDFFFGGQRFSWWLIAASLVATGIGSYSFIKYAQAGFLRGTSSTITYLNDWFIIPLFMFGWLPIIYFSRIRSIPEYFERRFGRGPRAIATLLTLLYLIGYIGLNYCLMGIALQALMGVDMWVTIPVVALITAIYITAGGQTSVIFTDLVQGVFLYVAGGLLLLFGLKQVGGFGALWSGLDLAHRLPFPAFNRPPEFNLAGIFWSEGVVGTMAFTFLNQGFIMRYLAAKSVTEGRKCLCFNTLILMPISAVVVGCVGWIGAAMATKGLLPTGADTKEIFVTVAHIIAKPGYFGFVMAALTAALMSTADTLINASAAIGVYDVYRPFVRPGKSDRHYLRAARVISVLVTGLGVALVPAFARSKTIFSAHYAFVGIVTPPMITALVLGVFWKKFHARAAFWAMLIGFVVVLVSLLVPQMIAPLGWTHGIDPAGGYKYFRALFGLLATFVLAVSLTYLLRPKRGKDLTGLLLTTIQAGRARYKGKVPPNDERGKKLLLAFREVEVGERVRLSGEDMHQLKAREGDIVYIADERRYLGGLRSIQATAGTPHHDAGVVYVPANLASAGGLAPRRRVRVEKIF
jgi:SSS family solute:Na+ symporter